MDEELEQKLVRHWPGWFDIQGFEHGDGWFEILWQLFADLQPLVEGMEGEGSQPFAVVRVREERGGLRVYANDGTEVIWEPIEAARQESFLTCEVCGQPGRRREDGWIRTRCDGHAGE